MTDASVAVAHFATNDFRLGSIFSRSGAVLSRHFPTFFVVTLVAYSPTVLIEILRATMPLQGSEGLAQVVWGLLGFFLVVAASTIGSASLMHATFQHMRRWPVRLADSLHVVSRRFFPLIGLTFLAGLVVVLGLVLLIVPGLILYTIWFVGMPACVVEGRGPWMSLRRSQELTKGYRWKVFALAVLLLIGDLGSSFATFELRGYEHPIAAIGAEWIWSGLWVAFSTIVITVAYCDLRVIKERADIDHISAVFD